MGVNKKQQSLTWVKITKLINKNVEGMTAQITNKEYIDNPENIRFRKLKKVVEFTEKGVKWVELYWHREAGDACNFTGCTVQSNKCTIQISKSDYKKLFPHEFEN